MATDPLTASEISEAAKPDGMEPTDEMIAGLSDRIFKMDRDDTLTTALSIGLEILQSLYRNDFGVFHERDAEDTGLRRLSRKLAEQQVHYSYTALNRCVLLYEQCNHFGGYDRWPSLVISHMRAVLGLSWEDQERLLTEAEKNKWTTRVLEHMVWEARGKPEPEYDGWREVIKGLKQVSNLIEHSKVTDWLDHLGIAYEDYKPFADVMSDLLGKAADLLSLVIERKPEGAPDAKDIEIEDAPATSPADAKVGTATPAPAEPMKTKETKPHAKPAAKHRAKPTTAKRPTKKPAPAKKAPMGRAGKPMAKRSSGKKSSKSA